MYFCLKRVKKLLSEGNMELNASIQNNDIIFIPEGEEEMVYIFGAVGKPGALGLKNILTYLDVLMMSGGPTKEADLSKTFIIRFEKSEKNGMIKQIDLETMLKEADSSQNYFLQDNDIVYVAKKGFSSFNQALGQILPFLQVLNLSTSTLEQFGVMQELRNEIWDQKGFVSSTGSSSD